MDDPMNPWLENFARTAFDRSADIAHDLKTPLNIAVLNLELLRMRVEKIVSSDDPKVREYAASVESELRRMGRIFDAFFVFTVPPGKGEQPSLLDFAPLAEEVLTRAGVPATAGDEAAAARITAHEERIRDLLEILVRSARKLFGKSLRARIGCTAEGSVRLSLEGNRPGPNFEPSKLFKFYYSDLSGTPDVGFAAARIIAETYAGALTVAEHGDTLVLDLVLPMTGD
ncbi:MAG: histidine kinase dimerization/phospho-acceptor domain-containing protein [Thermoanaerobaculia bacterium]